MAAYIPHKISADRIAKDIRAIAACNESSPESGYSRPTFSPAWGEACSYVVDQARRHGAIPRIDAAGNLHIRHNDVTSPVWLSGSHLDSVPTGGQFDGVVGVVAALEVLRTSPQAQLELIIFAEEEGTTFQLGMLGSHAWAGSLDAVRLGRLFNSAGENYLQAGAKFGVDATRLAADRLIPADYLGFVEIHIEQGASLWKSNQGVAVVTAINGRRQYGVTLTGSANHAGSTRMADRRDALTAAAEIVTGLEALAIELDQASDNTTITVGRLHVFPNALNVIPGSVEFTIDLRARSDATLLEAESRMTTLIDRVALRRRIQTECRATESLPAISLHAGVCERLRTAAHRQGIKLGETTSGALHDAAVIAPHVPTAMLFVASRDGISHHPSEDSRVEDIVLATRILAELVHG